MNQQPDNPYESYLRLLRYSMLHAYALDSGAKTVLDVGCANGALWDQTVLPNNFTVDGVDTDPEMREIAAQTGFFRNIYASLDETDVTSYDVVICYGVLEHVEDYWGFASQLGDAKALLLTVPNGWSFHRILGYHLDLLDDPCDLDDSDRSIGHQRVFDAELWRAFLSIFMVDNKFKCLGEGTHGFKTHTSSYLSQFDLDMWQALDETAEDLDLIGENKYYGAELYAYLEKE